MTSTAQNGLGVFATLKATPMPVRYLLGGVLINQTGAFVQTFLVLYLAHKGMSAGQAGAALATYSFGTVLGMLIGGELVHRLGPRYTIAAAMTGSALLVLTIPWLSSPSRFGALLVVVAAAGVVTQSYRPASATMLSDLMPEEHRVMSFSMYRIALNIGAALGPLLAAVLIEVNWDLLYYVDGLTALGYAALAIGLLPDDRGVHTQSPDGAAAGTRAGYRVLLRDVKFLLYLAMMGLSAMVWVQFTTTLPLKVAANHQPEALYSAALVTSSTILILFEMKITTYTRTWAPALAMAVGTTGLTLGIAGYAFSTHLAAMIIVSTLVFVAGVMISGPTVWAHPAKAPLAVRGRYVGASQAVFGLGSALGPVIGVAAWTAWGDGVWLLFLVIGLVSVALGAVGMQESSDPVEATS